MKKGWQTKTLGDVCHVYQPETISQKQMIAGEFRVYGANGQIGWHNQFNHEEPELILGCRGSCGTVHVTEPRSWINGNAMVVHPANGAMDISLLAYALKGGIELTDAITGAAQPQITRTSLMPLVISFPESLAEQQRIVGLLDEAFEGLATAKANAEKNLQNARALFESHLQSVFTQCGALASLSDLADEVTDGDHSPPPKAPTGVPFITISDIDKRTGTIDFSNTFTVPETYFRNLKPSKKPRIGDVLYTVTGATLGIPILVREQRDFCFQRHIGLIRPNATTDSSWLTYALRSPQVFRQATIGSTGAAQKTVSLGVLRSLQLPKVKLAEQKQIAAKLDSLREETQRLARLYEQKIAALEALKKSLLHQAFTGEL